MKLTLVEQETILLFNEREKTASFYTHNEKLKRQLTELAEQYPQIYKLTESNNCGGLTFEFPKRMLNIKFRHPMNENEKAEFFKRLGRDDLTARVSEDQSKQSTPKD